MKLAVNSVPDEKKFYEKKPDSPGRPIPGFVYKIVDSDTEEVLGPHQEGELRIKTEFQMNGYYKMDSLDVWDSDGFLKTGDIAYYDEDHCFFIVDRIKDLLKYKAWHICPAKLETIFYTHPVVQMCVVVGIPHYEDRDHLLGLVVLKNGAGDNTNEEDLRKYVDDRVGDQQKLRAGVRIVDKIPVTITDKLSRRKIKQLVLQGKI